MAPIFAIIRYALLETFFCIPILPKNRSTTIEIERNNRVNHFFYVIVRYVSLSSHRIKRHGRCRFGNLPCG
jgi:hypothetical protein